MSDAAVAAPPKLGAPLETVDADRVVAKVARRLIPFLVTAFIVAYLDRVNIGFAALTMNAE
ncbi:MAG: MFS transporter, partial [Methylocystis sp.]|nr:MFS transporter [Methylocystis sp.]